MGMARQARRVPERPGPARLGTAWQAWVVKVRKGESGSGGFGFGMAGKDHSQH